MLLIIMTSQLIASPALWLHKLRSGWRPFRNGMLSGCALQNLHHFTFSSIKLLHQIMKASRQARVHLFEANEIYHILGIFGVWGVQNLVLRLGFGCDGALFFQGHVPLRHSLTVPSVPPRSPPDVSDLLDVNKSSCATWQRT